MQSLLGSLGAVDLDDHKYAALPNLSMSGRLSHYGRGFSTDSHDRSFLRGSSARASPQLASSSSQCADSVPAWRPSSELGGFVANHGLVNRASSAAYSQVGNDHFEVMDHDEKPLPAALEKLSSTAYRCGALAQVLRYRERDYYEFEDWRQYIGDDTYCMMDASGRVLWIVPMSK